MFFLILLKYALGENLKYSEKNSRGFTKPPNGFAPPSTGGVRVSCHEWTKVLLIGVVNRCDQFSNGSNLGCRNGQFGLVVDIGSYSAVAHLMRFLPEMQNASKSTLTYYLFLNISKVENKICPGP